MFDILIEILFVEFAIFMGLLLSAAIFLGITTVIDCWKSDHRTKKKDRGE